jgi:hypothetical protein
MYPGAQVIPVYSPLHQPRLYATPSSSTSSPHTAPQFTQIQNRKFPHPLFSSPHTPKMQSAYHDPPSPPSPYITSSPTLSRKAHVTSSMIPPLPYDSPHLSHQFESLGTTSPAFMQPPILSNPIDPTSPPLAHQHIASHEFTPREGSPGTQIVVKCDVIFPPTPPLAHLDGSTSEDTSPSQGKALRVVFGSHPVQTAVHVLMSTGRSGAGQFCQLTATVPSWSSVGLTGRNNSVAVYVQVLAETHAIVETIFLGDFYYTASSARGMISSLFLLTLLVMNHPQFASTSKPLKRSGEVLESNRPSPNEFLHRRVLSNGPRLESPDVEPYLQLPVIYQPAHSSGKCLWLRHQWLTSSRWINLLFPLSRGFNYAPRSIRHLFASAESTQSHASYPGLRTARRARGTLSE